MCQPSKLLDAHHGAIFSCPLCEWTLAVAPVTPAPGLAPIFGPGVHEAAANFDRLAWVERQIHDHLCTHALVDWITKIRDLEKTAAELRRQLRLQEPANG